MLYNKRKLVTQNHKPLLEQGQAEEEDETDHMLLEDDMNIVQDNIT